MYNSSYLFDTYNSCYYNSWGDVTFLGEVSLKDESGCKINW